MMLLLKFVYIPTEIPRKTGNGGLFVKADPRIDPRG
jgi:hypothetical protein